MSNFNLTLERSANMLKFTLKGRIDSVNHAEFSSALDSLRSKYPESPLMFDFRELKYISSAGLRVLLSLRKKAGVPIKIINVSRDIAEIFTTTGLSQFFDISMVPEQIDESDGELIRSAGEIEFYRLSNDTLLKLYNSKGGRKESREEAEREINFAKAAFLSGVPALIPYNTAVFKDRYGVIYEFSKAKNFSSLMQFQQWRLEEYAAEMGHLLKVIHSCSPVDKTILPETSEKFREYAENIKHILNSDEIKKLLDIISVIPKADTIVYGKFHPAEVFMHNNEAIVINMSGISTGNPVYDLGMTYMILIIEAKRFSKHLTGLDAVQSKKVWDSMIRSYFNTKDENIISSHEKKILACGLLCAALFPAMIPMSKEDIEISAAYARQVLFPTYERVKKLLSGADIK